MKVLVVGSGAREHAILWKLAQSPRTPELFAAPGNAGTAAIAANLPIAVTDLDALVTAAREHGIDLARGREQPCGANWRSGHGIPGRGGRIVGEGPYPVHAAPAGGARELILERADRRIGKR